MMERPGLRQKEIGSKFGVSSPIISYWFKGTFTQIKSPGRPGILGVLELPRN